MARTKGSRSWTTVENKRQIIEYFLLREEWPTQRPCASKEEYRLGTALSNYTTKTYRCYDAEFEALVTSYGWVRGNKGRRRSRGPRPSAQRGENHSQAILTEQDVRFIRQLKISGGEGKEVAKHFGVSVKNIYNVRCWRIWRHLDCSPPSVAA